MINLRGTLFLLANIFFLFPYFFSCLYVEDTIKIKINNIRTGDFIKVCCDDFCSFLDYDVNKKTYLFIKENNIILYKCNYILKVYNSRNYIFYFINYIFLKNENSIIEFGDSFENEKGDFTFWKPNFELMYIKNKYVYIPNGYYEIKKASNNCMGINPWNGKNKSITSFMQIIKDFILEIKKGNFIIFDNIYKQNAQYTSSILPNCNKEKITTYNGIAFPMMTTGKTKKIHTPFYEIYYLLIDTILYNPFILIISYISPLWNSIIKKYNATLNVYLYNNDNNHYDYWGQTEKDKYNKFIKIYIKNISKNKTIIILLITIIIFICIFILKRKIWGIKTQQNTKTKSSRVNQNILAEIHVEYKNKVQTNFGSKIKDITDEDLINLIAHNKAETIIVCQP
ncbi:conserved Plasmodium protein, unknown function [Plasmodium yoelii]|uniref:Uncharacterized protein n=1 Tax=Plasmodium yoelii TaxID=5861 RepID=A0A078K9Z7_PLAYE|nr:conserved Plasmodium protein, unknown function [Plasmodium yoelii]CDU19272.1 conserved Plasmodium protein, unknown function [Plasmodium yoelii]VTZ79907.1 conserved Plasmodium protein, unknown function [Plasmodium yoelii]|eukprot:XP_022812583.1 conserved Plasmodium protein, unknown function [Plasmodium yoelii]